MRSEGEMFKIDASQHYNLLLGFDTFFMRIQCWKHWENGEVLRNLEIY